MIKINIFLRPEEAMLGTGKSFSAQNLNFIFEKIT